MRPLICSPAASLNGISGTWSPATISTAAAGTITYNFTPAAGQCAATTTMAIVVTTSITPTFTQLGPYCVGAAADALPGTSLNGISGTWSPATISTAAAGTITYNFTPAAGQCAATTTMAIVVTTSITPTFTQLGPYCVGATPDLLPAASLNGISGTWNPATISTAATGTITYNFTPAAGQCAATASMDIVVTTSITPTFTQLGPYCVGATPDLLPAASLNGISGTWSPATISTATAGTITYIFTPAAGQCSATASMDIVVTTSITPTFTQLGPYCVGATPDPLPTVSNNGITGTWNPAVISTAAIGSSTYTFTPSSGQCGSVTSMDVTISTGPVPTFTQLGPYCVGAAPDILPGTSLNGITGTWNPAVISTAAIGSSTYTFTPSSGQCGSVTSMDVTISTGPVPTFTQLGPYCVGAAPDPLPTVSNNGITGTWNPAVISTAAIGSSTYTFTPSSGQCGSVTSMDVTISTGPVPTFTQLGPYCVGAAPDILPGTSLNGITGTWNPAVISTAAIGSSTYTFTPSSGQCGSVTSMDITISTGPVPTFTQLGPYCVGAAPDILPGTSLNGITGTWNPAVISTAAIGSSTYTFTPSSGQCGSVTSMDVTISTGPVPTFTQLGPYCVGAAPDILPGTSLNGITGTWNPAVISTAAIGSSTYTFTPSSGQCGSVTSMDVTISTGPVPTFTQLGPYCVGAAPDILPGTSLNGITGTWNPAVISTAAIGSSTYTFTPSSGQCGSVTSMDVTISTGPVPTFTQLGPYCVGAAPDILPGTSLNGITGTWNPAVISTAAIGSSTYTFTPSSGQCGSVTSMDVTISTGPVPTFTQLGPYCVGATPDPLPTVSNNGITGTWNPAVISTATIGTLTYTFTPNSGQCGSVTSMDVTISTGPVPTFTQLGPYCVGATPDPLPTVSNNGITGTWNPAVISTAAIGTSTYTFTPSSGQCGSGTSMDITISTGPVPTFTQLGPYCVGATPDPLPTVSNNGITGTWNPAVISTAAIGTSTYTFTPSSGQCGSVTSMDITISTGPVPTFTQLGPYCVGATPDPLPTVSNNGITGTWNPAVISTAAIGTSTYTFTPSSGQCGSSTSMNITISTGPVPAFTQLGPYCVGATPDPLPTVSNNGITGTWNPAVISTASIGTSAYTFTPSSGQCGSGTSMDITISTGPVPAFTQLGPYCVGATPDPLPTVSNNGITGTWNPAVISTAAIGTSTYTFTPNSGQCGSVTSMNITISTGPVPSFTQLGPYCVGATPDPLPTVSNNGITGSWSPASISTSSTGTSTYTFTPSAGQCGAQTTMNVRITTSVTPTFTQLGPYCVGVTPDPLPTVSNNGITGSWSPASISTGSTGTATYTFTPSAGQCGTQTTMNVRITTSVTPTFTQLGPYCVGASPDPLPTISNNGITGSWSPASISTGSTGTSTYTFTPSAGQCGTQTTMNIQITTSVIPTFTQLGPLEQNSTPPSLPTTSNNGISGSWTPGVINTSVVGTTTYTFTPSGGQCASGTTMNITISVTANPGLSISKSVRESDYNAIGQTLNYTITVTNTGNVTLSNISVTDPNTGLNQNIGSLAPGASRTFNTTHTVTQNDLINGRVDNTATASCTYGGRSYSDSDSESVSADLRPGISISKSSIETGFGIAGDVIHYTIVVNNTGNVVLSGVTVNDPNTTLSCPGAITLTPGGSATCTAVHTITVADMNNGSFSNRATVTGYDQIGNSISETSNEVTVRLNNLPPTISCPQSITVNTSSTSCEAEINIGLAAAFSDPNDNISSLTWEMTGASADASSSTGTNNLTSYTFHGGVTTVTYTVTDQPGLSASCSFTVTVTDNVTPTVSCIGPQNRSTDIDHAYYTVNGSEFDPTVWDNCIIASLTNNVNSASTLDGAHFPVGVTPVIWTVTDGAGLTASCNFAVTVIDDVKPVALCKNIDVYLDLNSGNITIKPEDVDNGSWDNTAIGSMTIDRSSFTCSDLGPNNVTLTVTDIYSNVGTCTSTVTVHYAVLPDPDVSPSEDVICNKEAIDLILTNNIPVTSWTWTVIAESQISGASADNSGTLSSISQTLLNSDNIAHNVIYNITPRVYGLCDIPAITAEIWVNPEPEIIISSMDTLICEGESTVISVQNLNTFVRGQWMYDLTVIPDAGITGNTVSGTYTNAENLTETLFNNDIVRRKVIYRFTPRIVPDDGGSACVGPEKTITIWVHPGIRYTKELSDHNGFNISCYGQSNGYIRIEPSPNLAPYTFRWSGPDGFIASTKNISKLSAGQYTILITDKNGCTVTETFDLTEPSRLSMTIETSISHDGQYNIDCYAAKTGYVNLSAVNGVGSVDYLWTDGFRGGSRANMSAGNYRIIIIDSNNCRADSTVTLTEPDPIRIKFDVTQPYCPEKPEGEIRSEVTGGISISGYAYLWSDNSTQSFISNITAGSYRLTVTDMNACSVKDSLLLKAINNYCLVIPEAISPNGDLINDIWNLGEIQLYPDIEVTIYNRWGQMVWQSERGYPVEWDGKSRGEDLPVDSYHYVIDLHNGLEPIVGSITIIR